MLCLLMRRDLLSVISLSAHMAVGLDDRITGSDEQSIDLDVLNNEKEMET